MRHHKPRPRNIQPEAGFLDITDLVGRPFVATSGNSARLELLGTHGVRINWKLGEPTDTDKAEFKTWAMKILGVDPTIVDFTEVHKDELPGTDHEAYKQFLERWKR